MKYMTLDNKDVMPIKNDIARLIDEVYNRGYQQGFEDGQEKRNDMAISALEQQPCEDAVSRDAVIEATHHCGDLQEVRAVVRELPSVTQKSGEWIDYSDEGFVECPICGHATNCEDNIDELHYCFYCGAKMVEPQERSDKE